MASVRSVKETRCFGKPSQLLGPAELDAAAVRCLKAGAFDPCTVLSGVSLGMVHSAALTVHFMLCLSPSS